MLNAKNRASDGYVEKHHIMPVSCGGEDTKDNLVSLTAREHLIAHIILPKILVDSDHVQSMKYAMNLMTNRFRGLVSSKAYARAKQTYSESISGDSHWAKTDDFRKMVSESWDDNRRASFKESVSGDKHWTRNTSEDETAQRTEIMRTGLTPEILSLAGKKGGAKNKGMKRPKLAGPKEVVECPHCLKKGGKPVMTRYHFDKCKMRKDL